MASEPHTLQPHLSIKYRYRWHSAVFLASMFILALLALFAVLASSRASSTPLLNETTMSAARETASIQFPAHIALARAGEIQLMLPIHEDQVTVIGYHPVNDRNVVTLAANGHQLNESILSLGRVTGADGPGYVVMEEGGNRMGPTMGSLDVGTPAGTFVFSPVDGTIAGIRTYNLKGQCPDTEVKIQPLNQSNMIVVMTHLNHIQATLGQPVKAGVSRIGAVRKLDGCTEQQLAKFTYDSGNHVHMQVELLNNSRLVRSSS